MNENMIMDLIKGAQILNESYDRIREIDSVEGFGALLGTIIDQWFADHDLTVEDAHKLLVDLIDAHRDVNDSIGEAIKSTGR